ncbi:MAG TPA: energy transducer TonB [Bryobacteraceae bacterium]|jgi:outer membrane biosynthesis protein TonB|nr:energy transducer TonB [Bryobacteraceae bacterium]
MTTRHAVLFEKLLLATLVAATLATLSAETLSGGAAVRRAAAAATATDEDAALVAPGVTGYQAQGPVLVSAPSLAYPAIAKQANESGLVRVKVLIGRDGQVIEAHAVSGPFLLRWSAEKAIRQWRYTPAVFNSHPIEATTYASLNFHL